MSGIWSRLQPASTRRATSLLIGLGLIAAALVGCSSTDGASSSSASSSAAEATAACPSPNWVASWEAAPSDATSTLDATFSPIPEPFANQTVRNVITPHLGSTGEIRVHLTNRFNAAPVTFASVSIGVSTPDGGVVSPVPLLFDGKTSVTAAAGADLVSDPVALHFDAFAPLALSIFLPSTTGPITNHWNANATTFITPVGGGDQTSATSGSAFTQQVYSWLGVLALDVQAPPDTRAIVTLGDSITDGWVGTSATQTVLDVSVADKNLRYPDYLQHRLDDAGIPISVANAGISGNQVLTGGLGPSALDRFGADVTAVPGAKGVIIFEGINDLALSKAPAANIIAGLEQLVSKAKAANLKVWLATITPASDSATNGVASAPNSETDRHAVNDWIRTQADADGVFDFDKAVRDPANPAILSTQYGSPDRLHLSPAGYERLAATVDLEAISNAAC